MKIMWISRGFMQDVRQPPTEQCSVGSELCGLRGDSHRHAAE